MSRLHISLRRSAADRDGRRTERAVARALAAAPTVESAHEITAAAARR